MKMTKKTAVIIGAGPAGLTAAYELINKTDIKPIIYEMSKDIGGISKTVNYKGNRIDIGGHRFFSKSDRVMQWWRDVLPLQGSPSSDDIALGRKIELSRKPGAPDPESADDVMLVRNRVSRIFFLRKFFDYPISLTLKTLSALGVVRVVKIVLSYIAVKILPIKKEKSLEDFFINRFGRELYATFFRDYTEKVWGTPCTNIKPEWGAQRVKGLSVTSAVSQAVRNIFFPKGRGIAQKKIETSLIEMFMYPKLGPGQLWEKVAKIVVEKGGEIHLNSRVDSVEEKNGLIDSVRVTELASGKTTTVRADYFFSTMPVQELIAGFKGDVPSEVQNTAKGLVYRDYITVGLLLNKLKVKNNTNIKTLNGLIPDNWIYVQERDVRLGRIQVYNNWSPYLIKDKNTVWLGLEYFVSETEHIWNEPDRDIISMAVRELERIGFIDKNDLLDSTVIRMPKTYPAYFGTYDRFDEIRKFTDQFSNLFLIGRNGMHRYNNADHSMLTAIVAVANIVNGIWSKDNIWAVNTEKEYLEKK